MTHDDSSSYMSKTLLTIGTKEPALF